MMNGMRQPYDAMSSRLSARDRKKPISDAMSSALPVEM